MRTRIAVLLAIALPVFAACGGSAGSGAQNGVAQAGAAAGTDRAADEAALRGIYQKMPAQVIAGDTSAIGALFPDDGVEIMAGAAPAQGHAAVAKQFAGVFASMKNLSITFGDAVVTVAGAGDLAVIKAPYQMSYTDAKGKKATDHGTTMTVFKKIDGQWKILYDTNVSEVAQ